MKEMNMHMCACDLENHKNTKKNTDHFLKLISGKLARNSFLPSK